MMKRIAFLFAALALSAPLAAANAPAGSTRVQGTQDGYGDPVQVTIVDSDGDDASITVSGTSTVTGNVAHDAVDSGNPVKIGGYGSDAVPTITANGDRVNLWLSRNGSMTISGIETAVTGGTGLLLNTDLQGTVRPMGMVPIGTYNATPPSITDTNRGSLQLDASGALLTRLTIGSGNSGVISTVNGAMADGSSNTVATHRFVVRPEVYNGSTWDRMPGTTVGVSTVLKGNTTGGLSAARINTGTTGFIKASAGQVYHITVINTNAAVRYLHLYNKASAPTLSTDTPIYTIPLGGASVGRDVDLSDIGLAFSTGIAWSYTTDDANAPATAGTSGELHASFAYK